MEHSPAPALSRGLLLLQRLVLDGACSLEQLARASGWPKSSVLRLLHALQQAGVVVRDPVTKRYSALMRLVRLGSGEQVLRAVSAAPLVELSQAVRHTVELFHFDNGLLTMVDRGEPEGVEVRVQARIGFQRELAEADALTQVVLAFGIDERDWPGRDYWHWDGQDRQQRIVLRRLRQLVADVADRGVGVDLAVNPHGVRRYAAPLRTAEARLIGVLAVAQSMAPSSASPDPGITERLRSAAAHVQGRLVLSLAQGA